MKGATVIGSFSYVLEARFALESAGCSAKSSC